MPIFIHPYTEELTGAVRQFNERLIAGGASAELLFPQQHVSSSLPAGNDRQVYEELFLATQDGDVRGGFIIRSQQFQVANELRTVGFYRLPVSEGQVDRRFVTVGLQMLRSALREQPLLCSLGMGALDRPLPQMLRGLRWRLQVVPFFFKILRPFRALGEIRRLRQGRLLATMVDALRYTGLATLGIRVAQRARGSSARATDTAVVADFASWADELWETARAEYSFVGRRDTSTLNLLYPSTDPRFLRLQIVRAGQVVGWALMTDSTMRNHKHFGDLRVGALADCFSHPDDAADVVEAATRFLTDRGVDLIVSNQSHTAWQSALSQAGHLRGPSNFIFAASPGVISLLQPLAAFAECIHINRGDGDGPIHL